MEVNIKPRVRSFTSISYPRRRHNLSLSQYSLMIYIKDDGSTDTHEDKYNKLRLQYSHVRFYKAPWKEVKNDRGLEDDTELFTVTIYERKNIIFRKIDPPMGEVELILRVTIDKSKKVMRKVLTTMDKAQAAIVVSETQPSTSQLVVASFIPQRGPLPYFTQKQTSTITKSSLQKPTKPDTSAERSITTPSSPIECINLTASQIPSPKLTNKRKSKKPVKRSPKPVRDATGSLTQQRYTEVKVTPFFTIFDSTNEFTTRFQEPTPSHQTRTPSLLSRITPYSKRKRKMDKSTRKTRSASTSTDTTTQNLPESVNQGRILPSHKLRFSPTN